MAAAARTDGRLPACGMTGWEISPCAPDGLRVVRLRPPRLPEPPRAGAAGVDRPGCAPSTATVWSDEHWTLSTLAEPSGAPPVLLLQPVAHLDLSELPDERAGDFGRLLVHVSRAVEALPHVARAHVSRWASAASPCTSSSSPVLRASPQLRGTCLAVWDDLLPPAPRDVRAGDARAVAEALEASYGGAACTVGGDGREGGDVVQHG